jgi:SAM-dependent methyltransferase
LVEQPERARGFTWMLYELHLPLAERLADHLDLSGVVRMMDLGGGSGVLSLALLRRHPHLTAVVVDIPTVCEAARRLVHELVRETGDRIARHAAGDSVGAQAIPERIAYHPADFLHAPLPGGFDLILECDVGEYGPPLLQKVRSALNPGGRLVIVDQFAPEEGVAPWQPPYPQWAFLGSLEDPTSRGRPTATEILSRLEEAGFGELSCEPLPAGHGNRWLEGWLVIEGSPLPRGT